MNDKNAIQSVSNELLVFEYAKNGNIEKLRQIKGRFDPNATDPTDKYTPLIWAAKNGRFEVVDFLVKEVDGVELNKTGGWNDSTALIKAAESKLGQPKDENRLKVIEILVNHGVKLDLTNDFKSTALMVAAEKGHVDVVSFLVQKKAYLDNQNELEYTALILAAENGHNEIIRILCEGGAKLDIQNQFGKTALFMAAEFEKEEALRYLIERGANIDHCSKQGKTPLMLAAVLGKMSIVKILLENKANVNIIAKDGACALTMSFMNSRVKEAIVMKTLLMLLAHDANPRVTDRNDCTVLMKAAQFSRVDVVALLMSKLTEADYNKLSKDGSSVLHFAAAVGNIGIFMFLWKKGVDRKIQNKAGKTASNLLADFYGKLENEKKFGEFVETAKTHPELLEMISEILPRFKTPNGILNIYFSKLLSGLRMAPGPDVVVSLVHLAVGLEKAAERHPLEKLDLMDRLSKINTMLVECMNSEKLDNEDNVVKVFQDLRLREKAKNSEAVVTQARGFIEGPLRLCVKSKLLSVLGTRQMRSNAVNLRTCPAANFYLEGISKLITLAILASVLFFSYNSDEIKPGQALNLEYFMVVMIGSTVLYEIGKLHRKRWKFRAYFADVWNFLDLLSLTLLMTWAALTWRNGEHHDAFYRGIQNHDGVMDDMDLPHPASKALLAISAVPLSIGLLQYISMIQELGTLVLMIIAMGRDLGKFVVVFVICVMGFAIAFHGLFKYAQSSDESRTFETFEQTILVLFDASLGQHDFTLFSDDPFHAVGVVLFIGYIYMTMVVLINLVIATFSATHDEINQESIHRWSLMKARQVRHHLLIEENSPFCMLPPPLNLIPSAVALFHYLIIFATQQLFQNDYFKASKEVWLTYSNLSMEKKTEAMNGKKCRVLSLSGTVSDMVMSLVVMIPFSVYEIYLCLMDIRAQASDTKVYKFCLVMSVIFFPFWLVIFICTLLWETLHVKTLMEIDEFGHREIIYSIPKPRMKVSRKSTLTEADGYIKLRLKVLRGQINENKKDLHFQKYFNKPSRYVEVKIGEQIFFTKSVPNEKAGSEYIHNWNEENEFLLSFTDNKEKKVTLILFDNYNNKIAKAEDNFARWIANGRFEGEVQLIDEKNNKIGKLNLWVKTEFIAAKVPPAPPLITNGDSGQPPDDHSKPPSDPTSTTSLVPMNDLTSDKPTTPQKRKRSDDPQDKPVPQTDVSDEKNAPNHEVVSSSKPNKSESTINVYERETSLSVEEKKIYGIKLLPLDLKEKAKDDTRKKNRIVYKRRSNKTVPVGVVAEPYETPRDDEKPTVGETRLMSSKITVQTGLTVKTDQQEAGKPVVADASGAAKKPEANKVQTPDSGKKFEDDVFSDIDRERIFHGIQENKDLSLFMKNPYAFEIHTEIKLQLMNIQNEIKADLNRIHNKILTEIKADLQGLVATPSSLNISTNQKEDADSSA